jgi:hypothetical protein
MEGVAEYSLYNVINSFKRHAFSSSNLMPCARPMLWNENGNFFEKKKKCYKLHK